MILVYADTGEVLFEQNADEQMLIASVTKIMTALVVLRNCELDEQVEIIWDDVQVEGSSMYIKPGETYTVEELLYGMMLASGNDAALALARHCAGSINAFAEKMNALAQSLGMTNSAFENPHGLDGKSQYSTARDLAVLTAEAMRNKAFEKIVSTRSVSIQNKSYVNHNKLLNSYEGCLGVKTGYTMAAGRSLVSCAERNGLRLICVTLGDPDDWGDHSDLYDWAFDNYRMEEAVSEGEFMRLPVMSGVADSVAVEAYEAVSLLLTKDQTLNLKIYLPRFVYAPVNEGGIAGTAEIYVDGELRGTVPLYYSASVSEGKTANKSASERIQSAWALSYWNSVRIKALEG